MPASAHLKGVIEDLFETPPELHNGGVSKTVIEPLMPVDAPVSETGTPFAIDYINSGVTALFTTGIGRGGARNRADRESYALTAVQVGNLLEAKRHASIISLPFTRMITIHWEAAGVSLSGMAQATYRFTDLITKLLRRHGYRTAWIWVHENASSNEHNKGGHCHLLIHIPADILSIMSKLQLGWLRRITGQPYRARVIRSKPIGGRLRMEVGNPDLHAANMDAALAYLLKGASPEAASIYTLERLQQGGRIIGKRCGISQNIARAARQSSHMVKEPKYEP